MPGDPFSLEDLPNAPLSRAALAAARPFLERVLGLQECRQRYRRLRRNGERPFPEAVLEALEIETGVNDAELANVPRTGPLVVAANHPHGAIDGLALAAVLRRVRPDVRLLVNRLLARLPDLQDSCFFVDPFGGRHAEARSRAGLRAAHGWLRGGGALVMFPSGQVADRRGADGMPQETDWKPTVARLALSAGAPVVPAFIHGGNSRLFYTLARVHPALRTALLARELLGQRGRRVDVSFGPPLAPGAGLDGDRTAPAVTAAVRNATLALARTTPSAVCGSSSQRAPAIVEEIAQLPAECRLLSSGDFDVYCAPAEKLSCVLPEIGRLREATYRSVGEGTGSEIDLDRFDQRYLHLFSWDRREQRVVGAYRIGRTDEILDAEGVSGLYTRSLFTYDRRLIERMAPALELGRSFVRAEYQRNHGALLLLWKGIGRFVCDHPRYRVLFGPVSISTRYSDRSHALLEAFLRQNHLSPELAELVSAKNPPPAAHDLRPADIPSSVEEANRLVAALETDGKGMPVLLRHYLKLNARLLGFNVDPDFGEALDALMMVDLTAVDRTLLNRYFGRDEAAAFLSHHRSGHRQNAA